MGRFVVQQQDTSIRFNAAAAVDVVLFTVREAAEPQDRWQVLLVRTPEKALAGKWALPGVLIGDNETFDEAARRALLSKAGLDAEGWYLEQLGTYGDPGRDTRGRVISVAHVALQRSDDLRLVPGEGVLKAEWVPVRRALKEELAFDHSQMLSRAVERIRNKLRYSWVAFQLLPSRFTLPELRAVYSAILDPEIANINTSNFRKAFSALFDSGVLRPVGKRAEGVGRGRPGELYEFSGPLAGTWQRELPWAGR
jgi:8-oxo-dGTP diphosphatase